MMTVIYCDGLFRNGRLHLVRPGVVYPAVR